MPRSFVVNADQQVPLNVVGEQVTVLASGAQTGGYEIFRQVGPEGSGPPPHTHPWDESFYVIRGEVAFCIDGRDAVAVAGSLVHLPAGTTHWFRFGAGGGRDDLDDRREGASLLFADCDREISPDAPDLVRLIEISERHGMEIFTPAN